MTSARNQTEGAEELAVKASAELHNLQARIAELRVCRSGCLGSMKTDLDQYARLERLEKAKLAARRAVFRKLAQF
jgi:hypothetical protein